MTIDFKRTFYEFSSYAEDVFKKENNRFTFKVPETSNILTSLTDILQSPYDIKSRVKYIEEKKQFDELLTKTREYYNKSDSKVFLKRQVENFFRRSGFYLSIYDQKKVDIDDLFELYKSNFERDDKIVKYYAILNYVDFAEKEMKFKNFKIKKFSEKELEDTINLKINTIFYTWGTIDVRQLLNYCFICSQEKQKKKEQFPWDMLSDERYKYFYQKFTDFPLCIEKALKVLALYKWEELEDSTDFWGFEIPFYIKVDDDFLDSPYSITNINIKKLPNEEVIDPNTGKTRIERTVIEPYLCGEEIVDFKNFIGRVQKLLENIQDKPKNWEFVDNALGYLVKAFFSDDLEQLLWHIVTLEALLGENKEGLTGLMANRIASIFGENKTDIKKQFKKLYKLRCSLVHGATINKKIKRSQLRIARIFSRKILLWFLHVLDFIKCNLFKESMNDLPAREQILSVLDEKKIYRIKLKKILEIIPANFPYLKEWIE